MPSQYSLTPSPNGLTTPSPVTATGFTRRLNPSHSILLLDSAARPGAKILVSGGSRCNVTNVAVAERDFNGGKPTIVRRVLKAFPPQEVVAWFASMGVRLHEEAHGKLFPDSNRARDAQCFPTRSRL
jgi:predicted flavoprotein YhiN